MTTIDAEALTESIHEVIRDHALRNVGKPLIGLREEQQVALTRALRNDPNTYATTTTWSGVGGHSFAAGGPYYYPASGATVSSRVVTETLSSVMGCSIIPPEVLDYLSRKDNVEVHKVGSGDEGRYVRVPPGCTVVVLNNYAEVES